MDSGAVDESENRPTAVPSPDGKLAAWTETHAVMDGEKSESVTQVYLARTDGSGRIELTRGEKSSNAPAFSPDSEWVFFASDRSGKRNVYRIPVDGGEAEMLTNWTGTLGSVRDFAEREVGRVHGPRCRIWTKIAPNARSAISA